MRSVNEVLTVSDGREADADAVVALVREAHGPYYDFCFSGAAAYLDAYLGASVRDPLCELFVGRALVARSGDIAGGVAVTSTAAELAAFGRRDAYILRSVLPRDKASEVFGRMRTAAAMFSPPGPESLYLARLAVDKRLRGRGVGAALLEAVCERCAERGLSAIELHVAATNETAIGFYAGSGFVGRGHAASASLDLPDYLHMYRPIRAKAPE